MHIHQFNGSDGKIGAGKASDDDYKGNDYGISIVLGYDVGKEQITTDDKQIGFYDKYQTETMDYEEFKSAIQCIINY